MPGGLREQEANHRILASARWESKPPRGLKQRCDMRAASFWLGGVENSQCDSEGDKETKRPWWSAGSASSRRYEKLASDIVWGHYWHPHNLIELIMGCERSKCWLKHYATVDYYSTPFWSERWQCRCLEAGLKADVAALTFHRSTQSAEAGGRRETQVKNSKNKLRHRQQGTPAALGGARWEPSTSPGREGWSHQNKDQDKDIAP